MLARLPKRKRLVPQQPGEAAAPTPGLFEPAKLLGSSAELFKAQRQDSDDMKPSHGLVASRAELKAGQALPSRDAGSNNDVDGEGLEAGTVYRYLTTPVTDSASLQAAVTAWCTNSATAATTYGDIATWDTSGDMSGFFGQFYTGSVFETRYCSSYATFNGDIRSWDTSQVSTFYCTFAKGSGPTSFNADLGALEPGTWAR